MAQSATVGKLAEALTKAQPTFKALTVNKTAQIKSDKGSYSYRYADLASVLDTVSGPLAVNGLSLVQPIGYQDGHMILRTVLLHVSGEWIDSEYPIPAFARAQEQGSAITYARRYAASAFLGIAAEDDDDGKAAHDAHQSRQDAPGREDGPEPDVDPNSDAGIILKVATEIGLITGQHPDEVIREASAFTAKDGKLKSFTDPRRQKPGKWMTMTREKMERELHRVAAIKASDDDGPVPF